MNLRTIDDAIEAGCRTLIRHQRSDGAFIFRCESEPLPEAWMVILLKATGRDHHPLIPHLVKRLIRLQSSRGAWHAFPDQRDTLSPTVLAYLALRMAGTPKTATNMERARREIIRQGGLAQCSNLTKMILAVTGQLPWSHVPNVPIELIHLGPRGFVNIYDFVTYTRFHLVPFMVLSHLQFQVPHAITGDLSDLQTHQPTGLPTLRIPHVDHVAIHRCIRFILARLEPNGTLASYLTATIFAVFALQATGYPDDHPLIEHAVRGLTSMIHKGKSDVHQPLFTSTVWDTALAMRALHAANGSQSTEVLTKAAQYLQSRQQQIQGDWAVHNPNTEAGGWGFSEVNTRVPDVDDTSSCLMALSPFRSTCETDWKRGAAWLLSMQNKDGGWSAFDKNCNKHWLNHLPLNDMGRVMTDPSTPDITGRVLEVIAKTDMRAKSQVERAVRWLLQHQRKDGSWHGRWGIAYVYGTWTALVGLRASGVAPEHVALRRGRAWLEDVQHADGGFGESCRSDIESTYINLPFSTPSQTAWGLMGLLAATDGISVAINRAADYLLKTGSSEFGWRESYPTGAGVSGQAYLRYYSYPWVWPVLALTAYRHRVGLRVRDQPHPDTKTD